MNVVELLEIQLQSLTESELDAWILRALNEGVHKTIVTPNPEMILCAQKDSAFTFLLNASDLQIPDGIGLVYASVALYGSPIERHTGTDTLERLARICAQEDKQLVLIGGMGGVGEHAATELKKTHPDLRITSLDPGRVPLDGTPSDDILATLRALKPDVIACALGQGKQERFIQHLKRALPHTSISIGVGGALDMISHALPRASERSRKKGLEFVNRFWLEPNRLPRMFKAVILFPTIIAIETLKQRRFVRACRDVFSHVYQTLRV